MRVQRPLLKLNIDSQAAQRLRLNFFELVCIELVHGSSLQENEIDCAPPSGGILQALAQALPRTKMALPK